MTSTLVPPGPVRPPVRPPDRRAGLAPALAACVAVIVVAGMLAAVLVYRQATDDSRRDYLGARGWPVRGQAAIVVGDASPRTSPGQQPVPIASIAKVMTAYLVLRDHPLTGDADGFTLRISRADVERTAWQRTVDQSVVTVRAGEVLTERQALLALLLPSANNVAEFLARRVAGRVDAFVARMNDTARRLGMRQTHYADPSGFDSLTVSTATDQLVLARVVARDATFAALVATRTARVPVAGTIRNTDALLGRDGFVGTKTGSHDAAGGCFMFRAHRRVHGHRVDVVGVVLGQRGHDLVRAGLYAARQLVAEVSAPG
ncbi:D-alanyl-D-alanine carboxypeptidase (penicillin-binding protein 5/6) [Jatrophihabitans endophyticus]|uniref:D-alanyl-D-alanine carboxypeptidase (Penicillin-binding protein 5/6) n=1 Tax=Jatrophihabitans endophyticus TaxID=1206085 RepID=A0A1M5E9Z4_9ACTN|nr:D-alanyl-D-alanine carboxypeptidase [Jatrophihabitans endophyticus]SHF76093.1 D-alanyl-D-alanine carboxypeptidase (penicillin-binding protein 5/6) [Jatrophihabitans endophyticus]